MKKIKMIINPELFQGKKYLKNNKRYFEGWYFKNSNGKDNIAFIPGINIDKGNQKAFIQIITNTESYFINYPIEDFSFHDDPFYIKIEDNFFSYDSLDINIEDLEHKINIKGSIKYSNHQKIKTSIVNPNIMGPFSYLSFLECNHAIGSMKNTIFGYMNINEKKVIFDKGIGYIEKDWGYSFPKYYIWCEGNNFQKDNASFMCSIADIDFKLFHFKGFICVLILDNKEYRFTTYNHSKIIKYEILKDQINIILKHKDYYLEINSKYSYSQKLKAPINGNMKKDIYESISSKVRIVLKKNEQIIFDEISNNCGLEIVTEY